MKQPCRSCKELQHSALYASDMATTRREQEVFASLTARRLRQVAKRAAQGKEPRP